MKHIYVFLVLFLTACETLDSVEKSIYVGMSKNNFCDVTGLVMITEDPCTGKSYRINSRTEIITNTIESDYYIFENDRLTGIARNYYAALKKIDGKSETKKQDTYYSSNSESQKSKTVIQPSYSNESLDAFENYSSSITDNYQCNNAKSDLDFAERKMRQANNYYNINIIGCNNTGRSCMVTPQQCQNRAYQCQNRSSSCRVGDYTCTSRAYANYNQCRSQANNEYNQCQNRARIAAENQRRNCENQKANAKSQCVSRVKREQNNLIAQANSLIENANRKVLQACK